MQLQEFERLLRNEVVGQGPLTIADMFGCKAQLQKLKLLQLEEELLSERHIPNHPSKQQPKKVKVSHVLDEFIGNTNIPTKKQPEKRTSHRETKKQSPPKSQQRTRKLVVTPIAQPKLEITIDLPELQDPKTPKLMIQDIQQDLGALLNKMRPPKK